MKKILSSVFLTFFICNLIFPNNFYNKNSYITDKEYITGDDGVIRMNINILGHVKSPGTYLVYDGIDIMTALSTAGGYLDGANLNKVIIYSEDGTKKIINLNKSFNSNLSFKELIYLKPKDTIYIEQKLLSKFLYSSSLPAVLLGILNVALTIERTD